MKSDRFIFLTPEPRQGFLCMNLFLFDQGRINWKNWWCLFALLEPPVRKLTGDEQAWHLQSTESWLCVFDGRLNVGTRASYIRSSWKDSVQHIHSICSVSANDHLSQLVSVSISLSIVTIVCFSIVNRMVTTTLSTSVKVTGPAWSLLSNIIISADKQTLQD